MGAFWRHKLIAALVACVSFSAYALEVEDGYYPAYPATKHADGSRAQLISKGEYLSKMGDCISCHTNVKAGTPAFAGGLPIVTPFGTFYTPNITPDKKTGIGLWTEQDFIRALKKGLSPTGENYFPVFPFAYFANITDDDARALYAYFMSLPAVDQTNRSLPFPFNVPGARLSLWGWKLLFFFPNNVLETNPEKSEQWNRGHYLVDSLGHCSMCHTPLNLLGSPIERNYLTGTFIDGYWAPNISAQGLESVTQDELTHVFSHSMLINDAGPVAGPMTEVVHNSLRYLTPSDQLAIADYLKSVVSQDPLAIAPSYHQQSMIRGEEVYRVVCTTCHQDGRMGAPRIGDGENWTDRVKTSGLDGLYKNAVNGYNSMPYKGACVTCSKQDVESAVDYLLNQSLTRSQRLDLKKHYHKQLPVDGEQIYSEKCGACHNDGHMGAPILGDVATWKPLIAKNIDVLVQNTIHGSKHPKKGACHACTTGDVIAAIKYMVEQSKSASNTSDNYSLW